MTAMNARRKLLPLTVSVLLAGGGSILVSEAQAAATFKIDDTKWVSLGAGLRTSFNSFEDGAASGRDDSNDFLLDSIRLYVNGQIHEYIKLEFNTEREDDGADDDIRVLDAIAKFEFNDYANIWAGRHLPPSDRSNLDGPYYLGTWNFPLVQAYPAIFAGRDDGASFWGQTGGGEFKYQVGAYQGCADGSGCDSGLSAGSNDDDSLLYAARLTYNFWDPEPGYYNSSTYYGAKDILAVGVAAMSQSDAVGTVASPEDFFGWNVDFLMEKKLGNGGVATVEAAYYDYDLDSVVAGTTGGLIDGDGYFVLASYLFPQTIGIGKFQPQFRYQDLDVDTGAVGAAGDTDQWEVGLNYIIDGHNARISLVYGEREFDPTVGADTDTDFFQVGVQLQI